MRTKFEAVLQLRAAARLTGSRPQAFACLVAVEEFVFNVLFLRKLVREPFQDLAVNTIEGRGEQGLRYCEFTGSHVAVPHIMLSRHI